MHEYSIVEQIVNQILAAMREQGVDQVKLVHLRRGSTFSEEALRQAFAMLTPGTPLASAQLIIEEYTVEWTCPSCGCRQTVSADDMIGHLAVCGECGYGEGVDESHGLELVKVVVD
ncbi:MAG TPA: hydrogenase maturation nickel metallochaperone HypA [bacterium]|nr:hydrogenase maturation nickel metallochaperone HypA [bacterium]